MSFSFLLQCIPLVKSLDINVPLTKVFPFNHEAICYLLASVRRWDALSNLDFIQFSAHLVKDSQQEKEG